MAQKDASDKSGENMFIKIANMFAAGFVKDMPFIVDEATKQFLKELPEVNKSAWESWCDKLVTKGWTTQEIANAIKTVASESKLARAFLQVFFKSYLSFMQFKDIFAISSLEQQYEFMQKATPHPAPVDNLVRSMIVDPARSRENRAELKKHGFNDLQIDNIILSYYRLYDENVIRTCYLRGIISESLMYERMRELGYTDTRTKEIIQTWELLPSPQDLFTMVAHEAFEPEMYTKLGLAEEFPEEQVEWLEKQGISKSWAQKFWIAHWEQPSIGQGFEMLHRGVIDMATLDLLFRAVEIPSFWRDKLTKIAYQPLTRVDVRRMHDLGVVSDKELIQSYLNLGYNPENALNMANFTIKYNAATEKQLTRSAVLESYREGLITRSDAKEILVAQDYSDTLAEYYLTLEEYNRDKEIVSMQMDNLKERYLLGLIGDTTVRAGLNKMGLLGAKIDALIDEWTLQVYKYQRLPTKSECDRFLIKGIIKEDEYTELLSQHGFSWRHIQMYLEDFKPEIEAKGKLPSRTDLDSWFKKKIITADQYIIEMKKLGYDMFYIGNYYKAIK